VNGNIFNSKGVMSALVTGDAVFGREVKKLYELKGSNIYKLNGDLVGHLSDARGRRSVWTKRPTSCSRKVRRVC